MTQSIGIKKEDVVFPGNPNGSRKAKKFFEGLMDIHIKDMEINGSGNIPRTGPFLLVSNHQSHADGPIIWRALSGVRDDVWAVAGKVIADPQIRDFYLDSYPGLIYVERREEISHRESAAYLKKAFYCIVEKLSEGTPLFVFPESTRSKDGNLLQGQWRTILPALIADVPIIPCGIIGSKELFIFEPSLVEMEDFRNGKFIESVQHIDKLSVSFGKPILPSKYLQDGLNEEQCKGFARVFIDTIMCGIGDLLPEEMHGEYKQKVVVYRELMP